MKAISLNALIIETPRQRKPCLRLWEAGVKGSVEAAHLEGCRKGFPAGHDALQIEGLM
jgi:hypothetical protein